MLGVLKTKTRMQNRLISRFEDYIEKKHENSEKKQQPGTRSATDESNRPQTKQDLSESDKASEKIPSVRSDVIMQMIQRRLHTHAPKD